MAKIQLNSLYLGPKEEDVIKHFGIRCTQDVCEYFQDVKFVCMGGSDVRMKIYAERFHKETGIELSENLSKTERFVMYKTGPVLWVNHGMGIPSLSICMTETIKLMHYVEATDVTFLRLGTSGGVGVEPGTVVISTGALNHYCQPKHIQVVMGKDVSHDAILDKYLPDEIYDYRHEIDTPVAQGITLSTDDFFEGQARCDGPFCDYTKADAAQFIQKVHSLGVRNIEMEAACFAALTRRAGIRAALICVTFTDRLKDDDHLKTQPPGTFREYELRTYRLISPFLRDRLFKDLNNNNIDDSFPNLNAIEKINDFANANSIISLQA